MRFKLNQTIYTWWHRDTVLEELSREDHFSLPLIKKVEIKEPILLDGKISSWIEI
jgi:hypothetical protein